MSPRPYAVSAVLLLALLLPPLGACARANVPTSAEPPTDIELEEIREAAAQMQAGRAGSAGDRIAGKTYAGPPAHEGGTDCRSCHAPDLEGGLDLDSMDWRPEPATCAPCHGTLERSSEIRGAQRPDHDGDGDSTEPLAAELDGLLAKLLTSIRETAAATGTPICFHPGRYPHWMKDLDGDGLCNSQESELSNVYEIWTGPLLQASYNYQTISRDRGAWAHNFDYAAQLTIDSMTLLGDDASETVRPK